MTTPHFLPPPQLLTGDMQFSLESMVRSAVTAGALSGATSIIDTQMGYNAIDPTTGERVILSYGEKASQEILHENLGSGDESKPMA
jgi:hypothetical protein